MSGLAETLEENQRLRALLEEQMALLQAEKQAHAAKDEALALANDMVKYLERLVDLHKRKKQANERFVDALQVDLFQTEVPIILPPVEVADDELLNDRPEQQPKRKKSKAVRRNLKDADLPKRVVELKVDPTARCLQCDGPLTPMGHACSHKLNWVPGYVEVLEIRREKVVCQGCPDQKILAADLPFSLKKASCTDAMLVKVAIDKFEDHLPLNRQSTRFARSGVHMPVSTLSGWMRQGSKLLRPLFDVMRQDILSNSWIQGDDSGMPVKDKDTKGRLLKGRTWAFTDQKECFYGYSDTKQGKVPVDLLEGFEGDCVLVDGGSEFNEVSRVLDLDRAGCWAHARRRFREAVDENADARLALTIIRDLFMLEREWGDISAIERLKRRQQYSRPYVEALYDWLDAKSTTLRPKSLFGDAVKYARNQRDRLMAFLRNGAIPIHNNLSELALRQPITGRKNWLFAGSKAAAGEAVVWMSILASCRMQELDPFVYLTDVLPRVEGCRADKLHELTPRRWRAFHGGVLSPDPI